MDEDEFDTIFEKKNEFKAEINIKDHSRNKHKIDRFYQNDYDDEEDEDDDGREEFDKMMKEQMDKADELQKASEQLAVTNESRKEPKPQSFQIRKAKAVAAQTKLYDKVATLRIHLQKV